MRRRLLRRNSDIIASYFYCFLKSQYMTRTMKILKPSNQRNNIITVIFILCSAFKICLAYVTTMAAPVIISVFFPYRERRIMVVMVSMWTKRIGPVENRSACISQVLFDVDAFNAVKNFRSYIDTAHLTLNASLFSV